jgi:transposase-like protein
MEDYPKTLLEFEQRFSTEAACLEYFSRLRWPQGFVCPRCRGRRSWLTKRSLYHCQDCGLQTSVLAGTVFQDTKKPLQLWFRAIWHVTNQKYGANALGLQRIMGFGSYRIAWAWLHKLRRAMVRPGRDRLSGTIEVDETYVGGEKPGKRGRGAAGKVLVAIAAQEDKNRIGRIRLCRVSDASENSLCGFVKTAVEPGSTVRTDGWRGYSGLAGFGYGHQVVRHSANVGDNLLPLAHRVAGLLKRWLLGTFHGAVRDSYLDYYLDEYTFRFNRRTSMSRGKLFYRLVQQAAVIDPVLVKNITGRQNP